MGDKSVKEVNVVGAFDRYNFGDLLFPYILRKSLSGEYNYKYYGLKRNDFRSYGGVKNSSIFLLYFKLLRSNNRSVIVCGGEIVGADWYVLFSHSFRFFKKLMVNYGNKTFKNYFNAFFFLIFKTRYPYVFPDFLVKRHNIYYNSVGGGITNTKFKTEAFLNFKHVKMLSVRSSSLKDSVENVLGDGLSNISYVPDSVMLLSQFYLPVDQDSRYVVFQCNIRFLNQIKEIIHLLIQIKQHFKSKIFLLPLGYAYGHEDDFILTKIKNSNEFSKDEDVVIFQNRNVFKIIDLISNSKFFVGSSLHGIITAMNYSVPYCCIYNSFKLKTYILDWDPDNFDNNLFGDFSMSWTYDNISIFSNKNLNNQRLELINYFNFLNYNLTK